MRRAWGGHRDRSSEALKYRAVEMSAQYTLDVGVMREDRLERACASQADTVHVLDSGIERRVMHQEQGGYTRIASKLGFQPTEAGLAEQAASLAGHDGVKADDSQRALVDGILQEGAASLQV